MTSITEIFFAHDCTHSQCEKSIKVCLKMKFRIKESLMMGALTSISNEKMQNKE